MSAWFGRVGTKDALPDGKPSVWLITDPSWTEDDAKCVAAGCEEEGVPLAWDVRADDAAALAREACLSSHLEVGVGIDAGKNASIALVTVSDRPYVAIAAESPERLRWIGQAAARISKGQPVPDERSSAGPHSRDEKKEKKNKEEDKKEKREDGTSPAQGAPVTAGVMPPAAPLADADIAGIVSAVMNQFFAAGNTGKNSGKEG